MLVEEFIVKLWVFVKWEYVVLNIVFCVMVKLIVIIKEVVINLFEEGIVNVVEVSKFFIVKVLVDKKFRC